MAAPVALVTGATSGIGLQTALGLARAGMRVIIGGPDRDSAEAGRRTVAATVPGADLDIAFADFASLAAVRGLAGEILSRHERLDVLVNNAGLIASRYAESADGYELTIAVNHLAPFLLTNLLLERLIASAPARIISVASIAHRGTRLDPTTIARPANWSAWSAYRRSKLATILFTRALARRVDPQAITAVCLHPGVVATSIGNRSGVLGGLAWRLAQPLMLGPAEGAETSIFLATMPDPTIFHGGYVIGKWFGATARAARNDRLADALWIESARLVGL